MFVSIDQYNGLTNLVNTVYKVIYMHAYKDYNNNNNYNNTICNTYSKQIISISLQTLAFDNISHNARPSRILHNSIISWQDPIWHDFCLLFNRTLPIRWLVSKCQSW